MPPYNDLDNRSIWPGYFINFEQRPQLPQSQYRNDTDCDLPRTWNNEQQLDQANSYILKTALTHGSAAALKNYQADSGEHMMTISNNNQRPINSTTSTNQFLQDSNNTHAERTDAFPSLSSQDEKQFPTFQAPMKNNDTFPYHMPMPMPMRYSAYAKEAPSFSSLSCNHQQLMIPVTYNNQFSSESDTHKERVESNSSLLSNIISNESLEKYQQQNVQNNYGQNHMAIHTTPYTNTQFNSYINNIYMDPLTISDSVMHQCKVEEAMLHAIQHMEQKAKCIDKKKKLTNKDNILGEPERRSRQTYSAEQTLILEQTFQTNEYVSREMRNMLAKQTNLSISQIKIWFQNRRMKEKRNNQARIPKPNTAPIHEKQTSILSNQEALPQLQSTVPHHEGYQNYSYSYQQGQQTDIINQPSCSSYSISNIYTTYADT